MLIAFFIGMLVLIASLPAIVFFVLMLAVPVQWTMLVVLGAFVFCTIGYSELGLGNLDDDSFGAGAFANTCFWISMFGALLLGSFIKTMKAIPLDFRPDTEVGIGRFVTGNTVLAAALAALFPTYPLYYRLFAHSTDTVLLITLGVITVASLTGLLMTNRYNENNELSARKVFCAISPLAWAALILLSLQPHALTMPRTSEAPVAVLEPACQERNLGRASNPDALEKPDLSSPSVDSGDIAQKLPAFGDLRKTIDAENFADSDCPGG